MQGMPRGTFHDAVPPEVPLVAPDPAPLPTEGTRSPTTPLEILDSYDPDYEPTRIPMVALVPDPMPRRPLRMSEWANYPIGDYNPYRGRASKWEIQCHERKRKEALRKVDEEWLWPLGDEYDYWPARGRYLTHEEREDIKESYKRRRREAKEMALRYPDLTPILPSILKLGRVTSSSFT